MNSSPDVAISSQPRSRWRKWLLRAFITLLVLLSLPVVKEFYLRWQARSELEETIAELNRADPRWRLEDIEADRLPVSEKENSATLIVAARRLLPENCEYTAMSEDLEKVPPHVALRQDLADKLVAALQPHGPALTKARELKNPLGRHKLQYSPDWISTLVKDQQDVRPVAVLLELDVTLLLQQKEMAKAWNGNRALLNAGRSLGDEPLLISSLLRIIIDRIAIRNLERILGQGELEKAHLEERQKALQEEMAVPLFLTGMRGERAGTHFLLTKFETGEFPLLQTLGELGSSKKEGAHSNWWDPVSEFFAFSMVLRSHVTLLHFETKTIEMAKLPLAQRYQALGEIETIFKNEVPPEDRSQIMARMLFPAVVKLAQAEQRTRIHLACAVAGLGAEQFRLQKGRWPESPDELVKAGFLKEVPIDLYDGKPLRFRRTQDSLVIFSIGPEGNYDGKALDDTPDDVIDLDHFGDSLRVEFRLWDVGQRRQGPALAKNKNE